MVFALSYKRAEDYCIHDFEKIDYQYSLRVWLEYRICIKEILMQRSVDFTWLHVHEYVKFQAFPTSAMLYLVRVWYLCNETYE